MNLFADFEARLSRALAAMAAEGALPAGLDHARALVEPPRDPAHGDLATNAALVLAKDAGMRPRDLAALLAARLAREPGVAAAEVAGPGFINLRLEAGPLHAVLRAVLTLGPDYARPPARGDGRVNVEYVSANPTGPMHVGHGRGAVHGDALASLLSFAGYDVTREYYVNDAGAQVDVLARSAFLRYREALGEAITIPEGLYPGDYLVPVGEALAREHGPELLEWPEETWLPIAREAAIAAMMGMIRDDLAALGVAHDHFASERDLARPVDRIAAAIGALREAGLVYEGRLDPPKGQLPDDWEGREQTLFRSTAYGDDVDRPLMKSDGAYTYFAADIAYHADKVARGYGALIDVWGADHGGYVKRMRAAVSALSGGRVDLEVQLTQLVRLLRAGEPVRMSKRSGSFVTLREVLEEVGRDAVRFMMLFRKTDATLDFDLAKVREQSRDNPVFYVQYAHARGCSVLRGALAAGFDVVPAALAAVDLAPLTDPGERAVMARLAAYPRTIEAAAAAREPHRVAFYLHDLAGDFHSLWNKGKDSPHLRFVNETDRESSRARLALVASLTAVLAAGLGLLGVSAPAEMR